MAASDFLEIAACANAVEAEQIRCVLEDNGVSAFIDGANANTALSFVGTALGGVRVLVRASDAERATEIVESARGGSDVSSAPWYCGQCNETIGRAFEMHTAIISEFIRNIFPCFYPRRFRKNLLDRALSLPGGENTRESDDLEPGFLYLERVR